MCGAGADDRLLQHVQPVLTPEAFAIEVIKGGAEDASGERPGGIGAVFGADRFGGGGGEQALGVEALGGDDVGDRFRVGDVAVLGPDGAHDRVDQMGDGQAPRLGGDDDTGGEVDVGGGEFRVVSQFEFPKIGMAR